MSAGEHAHVLMVDSPLHTCVQAPTSLQLDQAHDCLVGKVKLLHTRKVRRHSTRLPYTRLLKIFKKEETPLLFCTVKKVKFPDPRAFIKTREKFNVSPVSQHSQLSPRGAPSQPLGIFARLSS